MEEKKIFRALEKILSKYSISFSEKTYNQENNECDILMDIFGITPKLKRENRQYWGRELGMCWQLLVTEVFRMTRDDFGEALRIGQDEPCDFLVGDLAIDTKYRIGSGDSGTLKKFKSYGHLLRSKGYTPVFLILRTDNLGAAISACYRGKWDVYIGEDTFKFIEEKSGIKLFEYLNRIAGGFEIHR